jgi:hypothetical protein
VIVYIEKIILFTKQTFEQHVNRLAQVFERIRQQNLHVHVEETFIASQEGDYLGYTISSKGNETQYKNVVSIVALAAPQNKKQLRSFL